MSIVSNTQFLQIWQSAASIEDIVHKSDLALEQVLFRSCFLRRGGEALAAKPIRALASLIATHAQMVQIAELYAAGYLYQDIAKSIGHSNAMSVRVMFTNWRLRHCPSLVRQQSFPDPNDDEVELFISLHEAHQPDHEIADQLGITISCMHQWRAHLRRAGGIKFRHRRLTEQTGPRLSQRTRDIIEALKSGCYQQEVAETFGVSRQYVSLVANTHKVTDHPSYRSKVGPSEQRQKARAALPQIRALRRQRKTYDDIAQAIGVAKGDLAQVIRDEIAAGRMKRLGPREPNPQETEVQKLWNLGWSAGRIADKLGIPTTMVYYIKRSCGARGMHFVDHQERAVTRDALIAEGLREGWDRDTLQQQTQLSWYTLADHLRSGRFGDPMAMPVLQLRAKAFPVYQALQQNISDCEELCQATGKDRLRLLQCIREIAANGYDVPPALKEQALSELGY